MFTRSFSFERGLELLHKELGISHAHAEYELGTDVAEDGVPNLVLQLGDELVRHRQFSRYLRASDKIVAIESVVKFWNSSIYRLKSGRLSASAMSTRESAAMSIFR